VNKDAKQLLKKQRDSQLISIISAVVGFILFLIARRTEVYFINLIAMLCCVGGGAYYMRTTCHITALKAYDMGQDDATSGKGYKVIYDLKDADIDKEDYIGE
jgi:hypothetical protein